MDNAGSCRAPQLAAPHSSWKLGSEWQTSIKVSIKVDSIKNILSSVYSIPSAWKEISITMKKSF